MLCSAVQGSTESCNTTTEDEDLKGRCFACDFKYSSVQAGDPGDSIIALNYLPRFLYLTQFINLP